jgi:ribonuclease Z
MTLFSALQRGETVRLSDGTVVRPQDVLEEPQRRKVCILGDTCDSSNMAKIAQNADVLVHEATFEDRHKDKALLSGHSTAGMAGAFAREIGAKTLVLTHFSKRYASFDCGVSQTGCDSDEEARGLQGQAVKRLVMRARQTFRSNRVIAAEDFARIEVPRSTMVSTDAGQ